MANCPHCDKGIETLSGFVSQAKLEERLNELKSGKNDEIKALSLEVTGLRTKATSFDAISTELGQLKLANTAREQRDVRAGLFAEAKVDPALIESFEQNYGWSQNGVAEADKKDFETWFAEDAKTHVLLAPHFGAPPANGAPPNGAAPPDPNAGSGINTLPPAGGAPPPPPPNGTRTNEDLHAVLNSPAYQNLPPKEKREKLAQLKTGNFA